VESTTEFLVDGRWYASHKLFPEGFQIVVGGHRVFINKFIPKRVPSEGSFSLELLHVSDGN
jgi:hypothetical protein